jgi:hypothetical protein
MQMTYICENVCLVIEWPCCIYKSNAFLSSVKNKRVKNNTSVVCEDNAGSKFAERKKLTPTEAWGYAVLLHSHFRFHQRIESTKTWTMEYTPGSLR